MNSLLYNQVVEHLEVIKDKDESNLIRSLNKEELERILKLLNEEHSKDGLLDGKWNLNDFFSITTNQRVGNKDETSWPSIGKTPAFRSIILK